VRRQAIEDHREHGDEEQSHGEALHQLRRHEGDEAGIGGEACAHEIGDGVKAEGGCGKRARIEAAHQASDHE